MSAFERTLPTRGLEPAIRTLRLLGRRTGDRRVTGTPFEGPICTIS